MNRLLPLAILLFAPCTVLAQRTQDGDAPRPNIIFIMADDQGWADVGCYGSQQIQTPNVDQLAREGMRFTDCYSGSAVCGPTRCVLMTGLHTGHCRRRDNTATANKKDFAGRPLVPLAKDDLTIATALQRAGYVTGGFGKWGIGNPGTTGTPEDHGFDHFFGYLDQVHAHDYYTEELWQDGKMVPIAENAGNQDKVYSHDVIAAAALEFVKENKDQPFFLYLPFCPPHGKYVVPDDAPYSDQDWSQRDKNYAAMITRMDRDIGVLMKLLKELAIDEQTVVFYTSDNGPNRPFLEQFDSNGPFKGTKRQLYEGGIRCPMVVRWPGVVPADKTSDFVWSHIDFFATACDLAGIEAPGTDGRSVRPTLRGDVQDPHPFVYWEIHGPFHQAVHKGQWKGVRFGTEEPLELYDLDVDPGETTDIANSQPDVVREIETIMTTARTESRYWPAKAKRRRR